MEKPKVWPVTVASSTSRKIRPAFVVVALLLVSLLVGVSQFLLEDIRWVGYILMAAIVGWAVRAAYSAMGKSAFLSLDGNKLILKTKNKSRQFDLTGAHMQFGKHYGAKSYRMFTGTLCHLGNRYTRDTWRFLGLGAEFPQEEYRAEESFAGDYQFAIPADAFRELLDAIAEVSPEARFSVPADTGRDDDAIQVDREYRFDAFPMKGGALGPMLVCMGGLMAICVLGFFAVELIGEENLQKLGPFLSMAFVIPLFLIVIVFSIRRGKRKGELLLNRAMLQVLVNGRVKKELRPPLRLVTAQAVQMTVRHRKYYSGPALQLEDGRNNKVRLLISDPTTGWAGDAKRVSRADYSVGIDAGKTLIGWVTVASDLEEPLVLIGAEEAGYEVPYWAKQS